jgi:hypothetical protein
MIRFMARKVPSAQRQSKGQRTHFPFENRIVATVFWMVVVVFSQAIAVDHDFATQKTLQILQMGFSTQTDVMQKKLLRDMALMDSEDAIPFFITVAMDNTYHEDTRRESLKGMIAVDSIKYRPVLEALQSSTFEDDKVIRGIQQISGVDLLPAFLNSLTFREEKRIIEMKLSIIHRYWKDEVIDSFDYSKWPSKEGSKILSELIVNMSRVPQRVHLIELWGKIRDEASTKEMVKLLDLPNPAVQEALIFSLSEPGPSAVTALGRFLQKSKDATLRKRTIYALRKIGSDSAKVALKSYIPQATKDEKAWIEKILNK